MSLHDGFLRSDIWPSGKFYRLAPKNKRCALPPWGFCIALTAWMMAGCGTPHATLQFTAPANVTAGTPFTVTVTVLYQGKIDTVINSPVHFTSSDTASGVSLPGDYSFVAGDNGVHTFSNGVTLQTAGSQTVTATDASSITGSASVNVVAPAPATHFSVSAPASATTPMSSFEVTL